MTMRKRCLRAFFFIGLTLALSGCAPAYERYRTEFFGLFDTVTVVIGYAGGEAEFAGYAEIIRGEMERLHKLYDIYNEYEGLNNLRTVNENAGVAPVAVDVDIVEMLLFAKEGYEMTDGAVNVAMGPVLKVWHDYRQRGTASPESAELPPEDALRAAAELTDINDVVIDAERGTVFLKRKGMSLDVGAAAKAYAEKLALRKAREAGLVSALISAGGNVTAVGAPGDGREEWNVGVQDPQLSSGGAQGILDTVGLTDATMAVSGGYQRYYTVDGNAYHHIIDPETLMPAARYRQTAVIHEDPATADMLSTALFILPLERGRELAEKMNVGVLWVDNADDWFYTEGYERLSERLGDE